MVSEPAKERLKPVAAGTSDSEPDTLDEEDQHIPFRMVLRPGVLLTKQGIQLRLMIARLGKNTNKYQALWQNKAQFKAVIASWLGRSCPLCEGGYTVKQHLENTVAIQQLVGSGHCRVAVRACWDKLIAERRRVRPRVARIVGGGPALFTRL